MKPKSTPSKQKPRKVSFAVDRDEIGISSEWAASFAAPAKETATVESRASVEHRTSVAETPATTVEHGTTGANNTTVARSRPRPLRSVADGLTPGQMIVYTQMYSNGAGAPGSSRLYRGGYQSLCRLTGLSKRGIQNIVTELQAKFAIALEHGPGHSPSQVSVYRVFSEPEIRDAWERAGYRLVAGKSKTLLAGA